MTAPDLARVLTLTIWDQAGLVAASYQNHWYGPVVISGREYRWLDFEADGIFQGHVSGEGATAITTARTAEMWELGVRAMAAGGTWLAQLELWEFSAQGAESLPPGTMNRIGISRGQVVKVVNDPFATLKLELGSALAPVGAQIPARTATSRLIGPGMRA